MIAGLYNQDSSFFEIDSPDIKAGRVLTEDIMSFTYEEELYKYNTGSIQVNDPDNYYSKVLRVGAKLNIRFGYMDSDLSTNALLMQKENPTQVIGSSVREGITAYIQNPTGSASANGTVSFTCNFYGKEWLAKKEHRIHTGITKGALIGQLLLELGCVTTMVNFTRQTELLDQDTQILQRETNYRFLLKMAYEWRAVFRISTDGAGNLSAVFISPSQIGSVQLPFLLSGALGGDSMYLEWKEGVANVIEYKWKNHQGQNGTGDNARLVMGADGKMTTIRYVTKGDKVQAYTLRPERIRERLDKTDSFSEKFKQMQDWLNVADFEEVAWAFDPIEIKTAPQGLGYSMNAKILGNPLLSAPLKVFFGKGFPTWFTPKSSATHVSNFYARKVTHNIDQNGYKIDLDIMDSFSLTGGSLI